MFELPNGLIRLTPDEADTYQEYSGLTVIPRTKTQFTATLVEAAAAMRARLASGNPRAKDNIIRVELIEDYLASPHSADLLRRHRDWREAGCPFGEEAMRKAGLSSPALDRLDREREAQSPPWVSIQSAWGQARLFKDLPSGRE